MSSVQADEVEKPVEEFDGVVLEVLERLARQIAVAPLFFE